MNASPVLSFGHVYRRLAFVLLLGSAQWVSAAAIGYWRFETGEGFTNDTGGHPAGPFNLTNDGGNNANDSIARPAAGPGSSFSPIIPLTGVNNTGAALFTATEAPSDSFTRVHNDAFNVTSFTIEAFVSMTSVAEGAQSRTIASKYGTTASDRMFRLFVTGSAPSTGAPSSLGLSVGGTRNAGLVTLNLLSGLVLNPGEDYWVAFSFRQIAGGGLQAVAFMKNLTRGTTPVLSIFNTTDWSALSFSTFPFRIGAATNTATGELGWDGVIDEVRFSDAALSPSQMLITPPPPVITVQPVSQELAVDALGIFGIEAASLTKPTYQWFNNGATISGETSPFLAIRGFSPGVAGPFTCRVTNDGGSVTSAPAFVTVVNTGDPGKLSALSIRGQVGTGADVMVAGVIVEGSTLKTIIQAVGPTLGVQFPSLAGVVLTDPRMELHRYTANGFVLDQTNDDWGRLSQITDAERAVAATLLSEEKDSALLATLEPGVYTATVSGNKNTTGVALLQAYAVPSPQDTGQLAALSIRGQVGTGADVMVAGIIVSGTTSRTLLIQAVGPTLGVLFPSLQNVVLPNPKLDLYQLVNGAFVKIRENDDWGGDATISATQTTSGATPLANAASKDCALLVTLPPGVYTANVSGVGNTSGVILLQAYTVP